MGEILTAKVTDDDGFDSAKVKYQWLRDDQPIDGATGDTHKLTADDAGHKITVKAEYQDGAQHAENPVSAATVVPQDAPNHTPTGTVTISGLAQAGSTLHAGNTLADEDGMGEVKYQWLRDGKAIDGATGSAYTLTAEDVGHGISVKASYTDQKAHDESKDSLSSLKPAADGTALTFEDNHGQREFDWAGFKWTARDSDSSKGAPTASGEWARDNARVDGTNLDLTITNPSGNTPIASEIVSTRAMGYGSYEATFHTDFTKLDPYSVFGFFTYQWNTPSVAGNHEIDAIELSHWGETVPRAPTTYYTDANQRIKAGGEVSYAWPETVGHATVQMEWRPDKITWTFRNADTGEVMREVSSTIDIPTSDKQQMHFNLWTYEPGDDPNGKKEGWRDSAKDGATQKVTLESFNYTPLKGDGGETPPPSGENHKGSVTLSGEAKIGHTLTAHVSDADGVPESGITWRWYGDDKLLPGVEGQTITLTEAVKGMQLRAEALYTDKAGHAEKPISDLSSAVVPEVAHDSDLIPPPAADAPHVTLSGVTSVQEGSKATYTVSLDKPASEDVSVDVHIKHNSTDNSDANITWNSQRIVIPKGETSKNFTVDTHNDGKAEGKETYTVEISNALVGDVYAGGNPPGGSVSAQSMIIPAYKYPTGGWQPDTYWESVHKAGGGKVPYVIVNPASGVGEKVNSDYAKLIDDNITAGIKNIGYIRTHYQTRPIEEVKAEVDKYLELYGKDKIHGYFFDEITAQNNQGTAYMAELYRYVKAKAGDKLVMANPGTHITDAIAPYADIFVTSEVSAKTYLNNYEQPKSAFENDPKNAHRIMHMIHDVTPDQYDAVIKASRERNAGWIFPTSDTQENPLPEAERDKHPEQDGNPYNALPQNFDQLVADVNNLGQQPADPAAPRTDSTLTAANIGNNNVTTEIIDANSAPLEHHEPQLQPADSVAASATDGLDAHATHHTHGGDGDDVLIGDGIDAAAYSQLVSHSGEDLLQYLGQHSAELLAASQHSANHELHGGTGDDVLIAGYGAQLLEGGTGADTFAYLLDSHDAASWNAPSHISDFDPTEGDRIVLAGGSNLNVSIAYHGEHCSCGCCGGGSSENDTYQLRVSDDNGHTRTIDVSMSNHKPHSAADILAHVEIRAPQGYEPSPYSAAQPQHQLQDEHTPLI